MKTSYHPILEEPFQLVLGPDSGGFYFDSFYLLAFVIGTIWMIWEGKKRNFPWVTWLLILASTRLAFIAGTKLITFSPDQWSYFFETWILPPANGKVILGGFLLGIAVFILLIRIFRYPWTVLDSMAIVVPVSIAIQRFGCLIAGCCFGTPTSLPWGISYSPGTMPHYHQFLEGWVGGGNSIPIHPFPIYESINGLLVAFLVWRSRKNIQSEGGLFLLSLGLWAVIRSVIESFRDPAAHAMGGELFAGFKLMQWMLLGFGLVSLAILFLREKRTVSHLSSKKSPVFDSQLAVGGILVLTVILTWSLKDWLGSTELLVMNLLLFPAIFISAIYFFQKNTHPSLRWATLAVMVFPVFLMSQTWNTEIQKDTTAKTKNDFVQIGYGTGGFYAVGNFNNPDPSGGCMGDYYSQAFEYDYWNTALGWGREVSRPNDRLTYGANLNVGKITESLVDTVGVNSFNSFIVQPYVLWEEKWFAMGTGISLGKMYWADFSKQIDLVNPNEASIISNAGIYPSFYGRFGPERIAFIDYSFSSLFPSSFPGLRQQFGIGSGFGLPRGNYLKVSRNNIGGIVELKVTPKPNIQLTTAYSWNDDPYYVLNPNPQSRSQFLMGLKYRFNSRPAKK